MILIIYCNGLEYLDIYQKNARKLKSWMACDQWRDWTAWVWQYESDEGTHDMFMDINEEIRFRVVDEVFTDTTPVGPEDGLEAGKVDESEAKKSPYSLVVSFPHGNKAQLDFWKSVHLYYEIVVGWGRWRKARELHHMYVKAELALHTFLIELGRLCIWSSWGVGVGEGWN